MYIYFSFIDHKNVLCSWDTVQTFIQFANQSGTYGEDALEAFTRQAFIVFEKDTGRWPQSPQPDGYPMDFEDNCETKIALACAQVKEVSPKTACYMYTESDWARTQYSLGNALDALEVCVCVLVRTCLAVIFFSTPKFLRLTPPPPPFIYTLCNNVTHKAESEDGKPEGYEFQCDDVYSGTWDNTTCKACDPQQSFNYYFYAYDFRNEVFNLLLRINK
jgi:hypothetical protein